MRLATLLLSIFLLGGCSKGPNTADIRQGVLNRLANVGMPVDSLDVQVNAMEVKGNTAEATVAISLKDARGAAPMTMKYRLEQKDGKWAVVGRIDDPAGAPHSGPPVSEPGANPHAGGAAMPSPEDLPPAGKKQ